MNRRVQMATELVRRWQRRLGLQDWTIRVKVVAGSKLPGLHAELICDVDSRQALLTLIRPQDIKRKLVIPEFPFTWEELIIHELCHLWFEFVGDTKSETVEEQGCNALAGLLYRLSAGKAID